MKETQIIIKVSQNMKDVIQAKAYDADTTMSQWVRDAINEKASREPHDFEKRDNRAIEELLQRWHNRGDRG